MDMAVADDEMEGEPCAQMSVLNKFHTALQKMVRDAILTMNTPAPPESIEVILKEIVDCSKNHILEEEATVGEASCARCVSCVSHNARKQIFFDATMEWVGRFKAGGRSEALELLRRLDDWLTDHVSKEHRLCGKVDGAAPRTHRA